MKKKLMIIVLIFAFFVTAGCSGDVKKNQGENEETQKQQTTETKGKGDEHISKYDDVLSDVYDFIVNIDDKSGPEEGFIGIWDAIYTFGDDALDEIEYAFKDLNGDNVAELLIGCFDKDESAYTKNDLYVMYALKDDTPFVVFEGSYRNAYSLKDDGSLLFCGSGGAAKSMFGIYNFSGSDIVCNDFYFTYPTDSEPYDLNIFHNKEGVSLIEESERLEMTFEEFEGLRDDFAKNTSKIEGTPFSKLDEAIINKSPKVSSAPDKSLIDGEWKFVSGMVDGYEYTADEAGYTTGLSISGGYANYWHTMDNVTDTFTAEIEYLDQPLYDGCGNEEWSIKFVLIQSDFGEDEEFYATLTDENTLLMQQFFPFDGTQGVSYQTYIRK